MNSATSNTSIDRYLGEISNFELLTSEQEIDLSNKIKGGDAKAREKMIKANLRLVVKIAREYANYGVPLADLISEGNIGLMKAVERFDPNKGGKLSTYASWWIKQLVKRALSNQGKTVRLPIHTIDKLARIRRITVSISEEWGREPSDEEVSEILGIPLRKLALLKQAAQRPASFDAPVAEDGATYAEVIQDHRAVNPLDALESKNQHAELDDLLEILDERESRIIDSRFGLKGKKPLTLEEISRDFGVTRERIRQIQNLALAKMNKALKKKDQSKSLVPTRSSI